MEQGGAPVAAPPRSPGAPETLQAFLQKLAPDFSKLR